MVGVALDPLLDLLEVHGRLDALVVGLDLLLVDGLGEGPALLQALDLLFQEFVEHVSEGHLQLTFAVESFPDSTIHGILTCEDWHSGPERTLNLG